MFCSILCFVPVQRWRMNKAKRKLWILKLSLNTGIVWRTKGAFEHFKVAASTIELSTKLNCTWGERGKARFAHSWLRGEKEKGEKIPRLSHPCKAANNALYALHSYYNALRDCEWQQKVSEHLELSSHSLVSYRLVIGNKRGGKRRRMYYGLRDCDTVCVELRSC